LPNCEANGSQCNSDDEARRPSHHDIHDSPLICIDPSSNERHQPAYSYTENQHDTDNSQAGPIRRAMLALIAAGAAWLSPRSLVPAA
jgi:hypothetical protein